MNTEIAKRTNVLFDINLTNLGQLGLSISKSFKPHSGYIFTRSSECEADNRCIALNFNLLVLFILGLY